MNESLLAVLILWLTTASPRSAADQYPDPIRLSGETAERPIAKASVADLKALSGQMDAGPDNRAIAFHSSAGAYFIEWANNACWVGVSCRRENEAVFARKLYQIDTKSACTAYRAWAYHELSTTRKAYWRLNRGLPSASDYSTCREL